MRTEDDGRALREKIDSAPRSPGCYLFYDGAGHIIYVGKSINLHDRVRSYFYASAKNDERISDLVREIRDVTFVGTQTELDALIEEYMLIKRHKPWFNAQHIRTLVPHYLRVDISGARAAISIETEVVGDARHLGPFKDAYKAEEALALLGLIWNTPMCGKRGWREDARPCLHFEMGRCYAPCRGNRESEAAWRGRDELEAFLAGNASPVLERLLEEMRCDALGLRFEEAQRKKDRMEQLERLGRRIQHGFHIQPDTGGLLLMRGFGEAVYSIFLIREGRVHGRIRLAGDAPPEQAAEALSDIARPGEADLPGDPLMAACLSEIAAYRRFCPLPEGAGRDALHSALRTLREAARDG
ncbi:GIY-YIG nuclease family protein [Eubacteriales bacterium OttesenSCG-928-A19]|nr:GIY-YIG nuclease family protein [Eubacteriales bacterium OttesenSCG-928-A19]